MNPGACDAHPRPDIRLPRPAGRLGRPGRAGRRRVQLIWGAHDDNIPVAQGRELAEALDADSFTTGPEAAHIVMEDAPEAVVAALLGPATGGIDLAIMS